MSKKYKTITIISTPAGICPIGTISEEAEPNYYAFPYIGKTKDPKSGWMGNGYMVHKNAIEDHPDFFELINERIEVTDMQYYGDKYMDENKWSYLFNLNISAIPSEKYNAVKQAIEKVLNDEADSNIFLKQDALNSLGIMYTQEEVNNAIVDAFNASRDVFPTAVGRIEYPNGDCSNHYAPRYMNAKDYLDHLKCNKSNHNSE